MVVREDQFPLLHGARHRRTAEQQGDDIGPANLFDDRFVKRLAGRYVGRNHPSDKAIALKNLFESARRLLVRAVMADKDDGPFGRRAIIAIGNRLTPKPATAVPNRSDLSCRLACEPALRFVLDQPFVGQGRQRPGRYAERFEASRAIAHDIVPLQR